MENDRDRIEQPFEPEQPAGDVVIPVIEEELVAGAVPVKTGSVRVDKHVERRIRTVETPLLHEEVEVRRIPMNRVVTEPPGVRKDGDVTIIPVVEEQLVITKQLVLKEEIHLITRRTRDRSVQEVTLERERAEVHRLDASGRVIDAPAKPAQTGSRERGLLDPSAQTILPRVEPRRRSKP
jgi:uncharacterized protein (TIGR02271 family)